MDGHAPCAAMLESVLTPWSVLGATALRAMAVYLAALVVVRIGKRRTLGNATPMDIILAFILGSTFSRAINGGAPLLPTLSAALVLVLLHWLFTTLARRWSYWDRFINGQAILLITNGTIHQENLAAAEVSEADLLEALRLRGGIANIEQVATARLERNGQISVVACQQGAANSNA